MTAEPRVLAHTTPDGTERVKTIPIMRRSGASNQVVASMGPRLAPDVQQDDRVEVTAEVEVTTDCDERHRRCAGRPYDYDPIVTGRLVLADGSAAEDGTGVKSIARRERFRCRQRNPGRTHDDLRAGEQLVADARMRMAIEHLRYSLRVNSQLMLTEGRSDPTPGKVVKHAASRDGQLSEANGFNCVHFDAPCPIEKVGVLTMREDVNRPLYVNLLVGNSAKQASPRGGDGARVARHGRLKVVRYPAALRG